MAGLRNAGYVVVSLNLFSQSSTNNALASIALNPDSEWILVNCSSPNEVRIRSEAVLGVDSLQPIYKLIEFMTSARLTRLVHFSTIQVFGTDLDGELNMESPIKIETH